MTYSTYRGVDDNIPVGALGHKTILQHSSFQEFELTYLL